MNTTNTILNQLKVIGVHSIISDEQIILEILDDNLKQKEKMDCLINNLLINTRISNLKKV